MNNNELELDLSSMSGLVNIMQLQLLAAWNETQSEARKQQP
jgi:hypothetical protein